MKAFLDTNVVLAAFIADGVCRRLFEEALSGRFEAVLSEQVLDEAAEHLIGKFRRGPETAKEVVRLLRLACAVVPTPSEASHTTRDRDDDFILAAAEASGAHALVTGDKDLLTLRKRGNLSILTPAEFLRTVASRKE